MSISLYLLGAPRIECDGQPVHVDTRKAIALAAYLVAEGGYQSRDTLCALLWSENDHASARGALRRTLSVLNTALGDGGLLIEREAIAFDAATVSCDLAAFFAALRECETHGHSPTAVCEHCCQPLARAVALYKGGVLQGFTLRDSAEFDLWQFQQTEHIRRLYSNTLEKLVRLDADARRYEAAIVLAHQWLALDPLDESAHRQLIQLYAASGQRALALRQYHECVRILNQELGVSPLEETTRLYQQVMENALQPAAAKSLTEPLYRKPQVSNIDLPLVGRSEELHQLNAAFRRASQKTGWSVVSIEGEAGIGKTRLVETLLSQTSDSKTAVIRCYENEASIAYAPLIRTLHSALGQGRELGTLADHWLSELARLLPDVLALRPGLSVAHPGDQVGAQSRLFEGICQALLSLIRSQQPGILVFEDLHWADQATFDLLAYLLRRSSDSRNLLVLTWRSEDVPRAHRLRLLLADYRRAEGDLAALSLTRLSQTSVHDLVRSFGAVEAKTLSERLYHESEGLPLFLHQYLILLRTGVLGEGEWLVPMGIQDLLRSRLTSLSETAGQILGTATVIGREFDLDLVRECSGRSEEEVIDGLDELLRRGIIRENGASPPMYEFAHEKMHAVVYADISLARRRLLHRRAAQSILNRVRQTDKLAPAAAQIAHHFHKGGLEREAAPYYDAAGQYARSLFAHREALAHFQTSLALDHPEVARIYGHIGDLYTLLGDYPAAIHSYDAGIAHAAAAQLPVFEQALGRVYHRLGEWSRAEWYYASVLRALPASASIERVSLLTDWSLTKYLTGHLANAQALALEAMATAEQVGEPQAQAQAHNILGVLARKEGQFKRATEYLGLSLSIAKMLGNYSMIIAARNNLALTLTASGEFAQAEALFKEALELCLQQGDRHHAAALHNNLADLYHATKQPDQAMIHLKAAVSLFVQVDPQNDSMAAEIWKLTEW